MTISFNVAFHHDADDTIKIHISIFIWHIFQVEMKAQTSHVFHKWNMREWSRYYMPFSAPIPPNQPELIIHIMLPLRVTALQRSKFQSKTAPKKGIISHDNTEKISYSNLKVSKPMTFEWRNGNIVKLSFPFSLYWQRYGLHLRIWHIFFTSLLVR